MKSERGIYYNLYESEYKFIYENYIFVFSSLFYLNSFKNNLEEYLTNEEIKLSSKLKTSIYLKDLLLINRYKNIEKRGFLVYYEGIELNEYKFIAKLEMR